MDGLADLVRNIVWHSLRGVEKWLCPTGDSDPPRPQSGRDRRPDLGAAVVCRQGRRYRRECRCGLGEQSSQGNRTPPKAMPE